MSTQDEIQPDKLDRWGFNWLRTDTERALDFSREKLEGSRISARKISPEFDINVQDYFHENNNCLIIISYFAWRRHSYRARIRIDRVRLKIRTT